MNTKMQSYISSRLILEAGTEMTHPPPVKQDCETYNLKKKTSDEHLFDPTCSTVVNSAEPSTSFFFGQDCIFFPYVSNCIFLFHKEVTIQNLQTF